MLVKHRSNNRMNGYNSFPCCLHIPQIQTIHVIIYIGKFIRAPQMPFVLSVLIKKLSIGGKSLFTAELPNQGFSPKTSIPIWYVLSLPEVILLTSFTSLFANSESYKKSIGDKLKM